MRSPSGTSNHHPDVPFIGCSRPFQHFIRCTMRRQDAHFHRKPKLPHSIDGGLHRRKIGITSHGDTDNGNESVMR
jgi:hypothetical protein